MRAVPLLVGRNGMNTVDPFVSIDSGFMREATNFIYVDGKYKQRPAFRIDAQHANITSARWHDGTYAIMGNGQVRDYATGALSSTITANHTIPSMFTHANQDILCGFGVPRLANSPFTAWTKTTTTITAANIECGMSHRRRAFVSDDYVLEWYAQDIQLVAGASASAGTDTLIGLLQAGESILRMFSMTVQPGNETSNVAVFIGSLGTVLIYDGDYPGATNWQLLGKYLMPKPASRVSMVEVDGDILVFASRYCYWIADLLQGGVAAAYGNRPSAPIDNLYQSFFTGVSALESIYQPATAWYFGTLESGSNIFIYDAIICSTDMHYNNFGSYGAEKAYLVYKRNPAGWYLWYAPVYTNPVRSGKALGYASELMYFSPTNQTDVTNLGNDTFEIESVAKWPYVGLAEPRARRVTGAKVFGRNEDRNYVERVRAHFDFGDFVNPFGLTNQSTGSMNEPLEQRYSDCPQYDELGLDDHLYVSPMLGIAGEGTTVSLEVKLKKATDGSDFSTQDLFAATLFLSEGGIRS